VTSPDASPIIRHAPLADAVYERLRDEIMHGQIPNGSKIGQVELAARYGVSRIPVREALRRLQAESLVIATPYHPFVVRNVTADQVLELVDVRAVLEDFALSKREPLATDVIAELRDINGKMAKKRDGASFLTMDREFHSLIVGPETMTAEIIGDVRRRVHKYLSIMVEAKPGRTTATREHAGIVDALEANDMELARRLLHEHVLQSRAFIAKRLDADAAG
jgi:DNA-binding GntR family transcriptional regulator